MAVNIEVKLDAIDSGDIGKIKAQLESLDDDLDIDLSDALDDIIKGNFDDIEIDINKKHLRKQFDDVIAGAFGDEGNFPGSFGDGNGSGPPVGRSQRAIMIKKLSQIRRAILSSSSGGSGTINVNTDLNPRQKVEKVNVSAPTDIGLPSSGTVGSDSDSDSSGSSASRALPMMAKNKTPDLDPQAYDLERQRIALDNFLSNKGIAKQISRKGDIEEMREKFKKLTKSGGRLTRMLNYLRPSMGQVYAIFAAAIPLIIGLASAAGAAAIALSSLAVAGGVIGILGALGGEADTLEGSVQNLEDTMNNFKQSLFQAIEPAADLLSPLLDGMLANVTQQVASMTNEFAAMEIYGGLFNDMISGGGEMIEDILQNIIILEPIIDSLARRVGSWAQSALPEFFRTATLEAGNMADILANVLGIVYQGLRVIYGLGKAVLVAVQALSFLGPILSFIADIVGSKLFKSLIAVVTIFGAFVGVMIVVGKLLTLLSIKTAFLSIAIAQQGSLLGGLASMWTSGWITQAAGQIVSLISYIWGINTALGVMAGLVTVITGGLAAIGGAIALKSTMSDIWNPEAAQKINQNGSGGRAGFGQQQGDMTMNFYGDMSNSDRERMIEEWNGQQELSQGRFDTMY